MWSEVLPKESGEALPTKTLIPIYVTNKHIEFTRISFKKGWRNLMGRIWEGKARELLPVIGLQTQDKLFN